MEFEITLEVKRKDTDEIVYQHSSALMEVVEMGIGGAERTMKRVQLENLAREVNDVNPPAS